jgi:hypothetical protein
MRKSALLVAFLLASVVQLRVSPARAHSPATATQSEQEQINILRYYIEQALIKTRNLDPNNCVDCEAFTAGRSVQPQCEAAYDDLYSKDELDFRLLLGYMDFGRSVEDPYVGAALLTDLQRECGESGVGACGFKPDPDDLTLLTKTVLHRGQPKVVRLRVQWSAVSTDNRRNSGTDRNVSLRAQQQSRTREMEKLFSDGLKESDVLIYFGHARYGAGPDFGPPVLNRNGTHNQAHYQKPENQQSINQMLTTLSQSPRPPKILAVLGCDSEKLFGNRIREAAPGSTTVLPAGLAYLEPGVAQAFGLLDAVLSKRCEREFNQSLNPVTEFQIRNERDQVEKVQIPPVRVHNLYRR